MGSDHCPTYATLRLSDQSPIFLASTESYSPPALCTSCIAGFGQRQLDLTRFVAASTEPPPAAAIDRTLSTERKSVTTVKTNATLLRESKRSQPKLTALLPFVKRVKSTTEVSWACPRCTYLNEHETSVRCVSQPPVLLIHDLEEPGA